MVAGNVRRLMYQSLIWFLVMRDDARGLGSPFDSKDCEGLPDALVDGVRRDVELGRDFLRRKVLVDEQEAVELSRAQPRDALGHFAVSPGVTPAPGQSGNVIRLWQGNP